LKLRTKAEIKPKKTALELEKIALEVKKEIIKKPEIKKVKKSTKKSTKKKIDTFDIDRIKKEILREIKGDNEIIFCPPYMKDSIKKVLDYAHYKAHGNRSGGWKTQIEMVLKFFHLPIPQYNH